MIFMDTPSHGVAQSGASPDTKSWVDRTSELRKKGYIGRRLGPKQMTTDTAVRVTRMVVHERGR